MRQATLAFVLEGSRVLLGVKKRGFGAGKWNGFGGKVEPGESVEAAAVRELWEESGVKADLVKRGELTFVFRDKPEWNQVVHVFVGREFAGLPIETDEMRPEWVERSRLPFEKMWVDDIHWLPHVLAGKIVKGSFVFDGEQLLEHAVMVEEKK